jgi:hypothetical protein
MYSTMMTPAWMDAPNRAINPTPAETLMCVEVKYSAASLPTRATPTLNKCRHAHLAEPKAL